MDILVIGKFYADSFASHVSETLADMGHNVRRFEPGLKRTGIFAGFRIGAVDRAREFIHQGTDNVPSVRRIRMRHLWNEVDKGPLDLAVVCYDFLMPAEVSELKRRSRAIVALWFPDAFVNFGRSYFMNAPYDALFFKDPFIVQRIGAVLGSPVYYLPECFNESRHAWKPDGSNRLEYDCDITSAGNMHSWRVAFFSHLAGYDVRLWGIPPPSWLDDKAVVGMFQGRLVLNEEKARIFLKARIVLNNLHYGEVWGLNARAFEAAGIGAFQMLDWRPGLGQLFVDGEELVSFNGISDLKGKISYWLPREEERRSIAAAGKRRACAEHTYRHRLMLMLETMAGRERGFPMLL